MPEVSQGLINGSVRLVASVLLAAYAQTALAAATGPDASKPGRPVLAEPGSREGETGAPAGQLPTLKVMMQQASVRLAEANSSSELTGSGPYPAKLVVDLALPNATIYRPADLGAMGRRKLGLLIWGNGGCTNDGASARAHLAEIASHGYLVIAPGIPLTGPVVSHDASGFPAPQPPVPMTTTIGDLRKLLDWALAENERPGSPYFGRIDPDAVAAAGHSCGGMQAILLGDDPRVRTVVVHNSGVNPAIPSNPPLVMDMERLRGLRRSVLFIVGGESDVLWTEANRSFAAVEGIAAAFVSSDVGHGGTFAQPHGGMAARIALDWLEWQLRGDRKASATFVGADCGLCKKPDWEIRKKNIP